MDGKLVPWNEANIHVLTHTLHYGLGVFEGIRCYNSMENGPAIFRLQEHVDRLFQSAVILGIDVPFSNKEIHDAIIQVVLENKLEECYIRPIVYLGDNKMGLNPKDVDAHCAIAAWPWGTYLGEDGLNKGIRVRVSSFTRHHVNITMTKAKACGYYIFASRILNLPFSLIGNSIGEVYFQRSASLQKEEKKEISKKLFLTLTEISFI